VKELREQLIKKRKDCQARRAEKLKAYNDAKKNAAQAKKLTAQIERAKKAAERARKNAEKALKAKANRLARMQKQEANRKMIIERRRKNLTTFSSELKSRTASNQEEANEIWETAKDVMKKYNDYKASLTSNNKGYDEKYIGCY